MTPSAHVDRFARQQLPPPGSWPELSFELPELQFPSGAVSTGLPPQRAAAA